MNLLVAGLPQRLNFSPSVLSLPNRFEPVWSGAVGLNPGLTKLVHYGPRLYLYQGPEENLRQVLPHGLGSGPALSVAAYGPGYESPAVLTDREGNLWRWDGLHGPIQVWATDLPGKDAAGLGLPDHRLLVLREHGGTWESELVDTGRARSLWVKQEALTGVLPVGDLLLACPLQAVKTIIALDVESGEVRWQRAFDRPPGDLVAAKEGLLWISTEENGIVALSLKSGQPVHSLKLTNNRLPQGVVDTHGIWHVCNGLNYQKVRLSADNPQVYDYVEFENTTPAPTTAGGQLALVLEDGRLLFSDDQGRVWALLPGQPGRPVCLWDKSRVYNIGIVQEALVLLDWEGRLTILR